MDTAKIKDSAGLCAAAAALLILVTVCLLPSTGPTIRGQIGMLIRPPDGLRIAADDLAESYATDNTAGRHAQPDDTAGNYDSRLSAAISISSTKVGARQRALEAMAAAFPARRPAIYAHLLRYSLMGEVRLGRDAEVEKYMNPSSTPTTPVGGRAVSAEALEAFNTAATEAEKLDPDNAYFTMLRAMGKFIVHNDDDGMALLLNAARKPKFDDYCTDEADARWRNVRSRGCPTALGHAAIQYTLLFPHFAQLRAMARLTNYLSVKMEKAGKTKRALELRIATGHLGALMRSQGKTLIADLVGIAIVAIAWSRLNGDKYDGMSEHAWTALSADDKQLRRVSAYVNWAKSLGRTDEAAFASSEFAADRAVRAIGTDGLDRGALSEIGIKALINDWKLSMVLGANALIMLTLCISAIVLKALKQDGGNASLIVTGVIAALAILMCIQMDWALPFNTLAKTMFNMTSDTGDGSTNTGGALEAINNSPVAVRMIACLFSLAAPAIALLTAGISRIVRRSDERSVLSRTLRTGGSVAALLLVIGYTSAAISTEQHERVLDETLRRMSQNEGRYLAEMTHKHWPE